ncbi:MAG: hypothetical protein PHY34_00820 [Patescibacteria group bacterium]|nr:hypothetical protein [Patescibacteria group bacterium]MDD5715828.1 hypothetical protein [Patescibacteria group bacterium]
MNTPKDEWSCLPDHSHLHLSGTRTAMPQIVSRDGRKRVSRCPDSPTGKHKWHTPMRPPYAIDDPPDCCEYCGLPRNEQLKLK